MQGPLHRASERLAAAIERYLYGEPHPEGPAYANLTNNPAYQNTDFLAWAVAEFDRDKHASGSPGEDDEWNPEAVYKEEFLGGAEGNTHSKSNEDNDLNYVKPNPKKDKA